MDIEKDYLCILSALDDVPFPIGKKLLVDFLQGNEKNESIERNSLDDKPSFGSLSYDSSEIEEILENLVKHDFVRFTTVNGKKFWKVLELTEKGRMEIDNPCQFMRLVEKDNQICAKKTEIRNSLNNSMMDKVSNVTEEDRKLFSAFGKMLEGFNDEQKKAIISEKTKILCIAGAGSGKTTVLTNRVEFLINCRSVDPKKILAITFTRKARNEMMTRLSGMQNTTEVEVHTFNSFCEKILRKHNDIVYDKNVRVIEYRDKLQIIGRALQSLNSNMERAIYTYFTVAQRRLKTPEQLANIFMNDCFFLRDYMKLKSCDVNSLCPDSDAAILVFEVCKYIEKFMYNNGLRDFADQLVDTMTLFCTNKELIPHYEHILIDEYQDVNSMQIKLVDVLNPENIFAVGDPRQSIYGWRGSDIRFLMNFSEKYPGSQLLALTDNYRSTKEIVELINSSIRYMGVADLKSAVKIKTDEKNSIFGDNDKAEKVSSKKKEPDVRLLKFDNEDVEFEFVIQRILSSTVPRNEIFVLARTNRQLVELSGMMQARGVSYVIRSDELRKTAEAKENDVTLATIHAIKGLEAEMVFVIGCTPNNFPCKGSEHPVTEMVKLDEYNKEDEERRLFYVAMSRAKKTLYISYSGTKPTYYITDEMLALLGKKSLEKPASTMTKNRISGDNSSVYKEQGNNSIKYHLNKHSIDNEPSDDFILPSAKRNLSSGKLISRLKEWRLEASRREGKAAYIIMHDSTLFAIAEQMPLTLQDLERINGIGPTKIMRYGEELLDIINGY
jgi:superfamily I DNA/RNA helicase